MTSHLEESLQRDIDRLLQKVNESAGLVERALRESVQALVERNSQLAYLVILRDRRIDELEKQIDRLCLEFLVRQQPVAQHLRLAYVTIKINADLERIGDYAESIARQALKLNKLPALPCKEQFAEMAGLAISMFRHAMKALLQEEVNLARSTILMDEQVDSSRNSIQAELLRQIQSGQLSMEALNPLMTVARRLERVADQSKNICEEIVYLCTGEFGKHKGTELLRVLFVDEDNGCRSQMAEALGNALGHPRLMFASAGLEPKQVEATAVKFLAEKGIDISRARTQAIEQVPNLEHYRVIVTFSKEAAKRLPPTPSKTVLLDWSIPDPTRGQGTEAEVRNAYEGTYRAIREQLKDLAEAILGEQNEQE